MWAYLFFSLSTITAKTMLSTSKTKCKTSNIMASLSKYIDTKDIVIESDTMKSENILIALKSFDKINFIGKKYIEAGIVSKKKMGFGKYSFLTKKLTIIMIAMKIISILSFLFMVKYIS
jgi:hypothetical protein